MTTTWYTDTAESQHGLVTRRQLRARLEPHQIDHLLTSGVFVGVRRGVFRLAGAPQTWEQQLLAACLAGGVTARASYGAAAALWRLLGFAPDDLVITVGPRRRARLDGVVVHQSNADAAAHRTKHHRIPVTTVARTLADLSWTMREFELGPVVDDAVRRGLTSLAAYERVASDLRRRGRRRTTVTEAVLDARGGALAGTESGPERRIARALVAAGLPRPVVQHRVKVGGRSYRIDLAYPEQMLAIEYDGWEHHGTRTAFDRDRDRANQLEVVGWTVLRFTSTSTDAAVVATVRAALATRLSVA
jgi:very-short-patch-repair endonuclease